MTGSDSPTSARCSAYQWLFPGKKLLFMGGEFGQSREWNANAELDWWLLDAGPYHRGLQTFVADLNRLYQKSPALWQADYDHAGFSWIDCNDRDNSVLCFCGRLRMAGTRPWSSLISRRCHGKPIASASRGPATGKRS